MGVGQKYTNDLTPSQNYFKTEEKAQDLKKFQNYDNLSRDE
jgi:hypothetical protein